MVSFAIVCDVVIWFSTWMESRSMLTQIVSPSTESEYGTAMPETVTPESASAANVPLESAMSL